MFKTVSEDPRLPENTQVPQESQHKNKNTYHQQTWCDTMDFKFPTTPPWGSVPLKSIEVGFWDRRLLRINPCSVWKLCRQLVPDKHLNLKPLKLSWQIQFFYFWKLCLQAICLQFCLLVFLILFSFFAFFQERHFCHSYYSLLIYFTLSPYPIFFHICSTIIGLIHVIGV